MTKQDMTSRETWSAADWLRHAAAALRRMVTDGPAQWGDPDAGRGDAQRRPVLEDMPTRTAFPAARPPSIGDPMPAGLRDPMRDFEDAARSARPRAPAARWMPIVSPVIAEPLAAMLDALADGAEKTVQAGGSVAEDPYQSAVDVARLIVDATAASD
ncbi:hypothetical protein [Pseudonocardia asaccharolytica]|uniref:Uncharacterized protein n=1 Tax=Pseudonocardia asaccharolytica DSM 44247 = NBRC 16224 TaxID=1123024 RepID=A0A511D203_9PSEU|nr:hypothetical protein [Pseudonocardia asaccharolytica]GEL18810.1 hypothetical protein PA7_26470 [Pseudonocardia asaccharolytica DSM 44247 = NBRC 16224]